MDRKAGVGLGASVLVGLTAAGCAAFESSQRDPHVPASVQRELPTQESLGNLCPGASTSPEVERDIRRRADVLIRELRRRPDHLVTYTYYYSDEPKERRDITIRKLAEEQLADIESGGPNCAPELERRIRAAM